MPTLEWKGKNKMLQYSQDDTYQVLTRKYSYDAYGEHESDNGSENMIIHGDNLAVMQSLMMQYEAAIKCIYIDPPYNTGTSNWIYNDNASDIEIDKLLKENKEEKKVHLNRHDKWLCMMYPRLQLMQRLLREDGAIFVSIDDNEHANLIEIMNEIFGKANYITSIVWERKSSAKGVPPVNMMVKVHEYIVAYQKSSKFRFKGEKRNAETDGFKNPDNDTRGPWRMSNIKSTTSHNYFTITNPNTGRQYTNTWAFSEESLNRMIAENRILWKASLPKQKEYLNEMKNESKAIKNSWGVFDPQSTTMFLKNIIPDIKFDNPKPISLMNYLISTVLSTNDIILDAFAGSGTTAHAVLNQNKEDGGKRKFMLIEKMDYAAQVTAERVKQVICGYKADTKHTLYDQKITVKNLKNGDKLIHDADNIAENARKSGMYSNVSKPKVIDGHLKVIGTITADKSIEETGGSFNYYELE